MALYTAWIAWNLTVLSIISWIIVLQCYNFIFQESEPKQALFEHITIVYEANFLKCERKLTSDVWNVAKSSRLWSDRQSLFEIAQNIGCTSLIQSPVLYCVKAHVQKRYFFNLKLPGALKSSIFWKIRKFCYPKGSVFWGEVWLDFPQACDEV